MRILICCAEHVRRLSKFNLMEWLITFYIITDTHLGHATFKKNGLRPVDYEEQIFSNWNRLVKNEDIVIHLGDVVEEDNQEMLEKFLALPGKKILIRGNHDTDTVAERLTCGVNFCCDELVMNFAGMRILFTHKPKYRHEYDINIHGHLHTVNTLSDKKLFLPIALEYMGYAPLAMDDNFIAKLKNLVGNFWLRNEKPTPEQFKTFGEAPIMLSRIGEENIVRKKKAELLLRRAEMEFFIDSNFLDNYAVRIQSEELQSLFLHGNISFEQFKNEMILLCRRKLPFMETLNEKSAIENTH